MAQVAGGMVMILVATGLMVFNRPSSTLDRATWRSRLVAWAVAFTLALLGSSLIALGLAAAG